MTKPLDELTNRELDQLIANGHIGTNTKQIKELWNFYVSVEEEKKRRNLKLREIKKILPIGNCYRTNTAFGTYLFRVIDCKEAPKRMHITHFCAIDGVGYSTYKNYENVEIEVDGGVNPETAKICREFGANVLVAGNAVYSASDPAAMIKTLRGQN